MRILESHAEYTGGFRLTNAQAAQLAAACAAAVAALKNQAPPRAATE
jgi:hypothetical protein